MNISQPLFFISKTNRKKAFRLQTTIEKINNKIIVVKSPLDSTSSQHLHKMIDNYNNLKELINGKNISLVEAKKGENDSLVFEYIHGSSMERVLIEKILDLKEKDVINNINQLFDIINMLKVSSQIPTKSTEYVKIFGNYYTTSTPCVSPGLIDLNFDNFIIDSKNKWWLIDYEWCYDFPVPVNYLRSRILWFFFIRHKELLGYNYKKIKLRNYHNLYIPEYIFKAFEKDFINLSLMIDSEASFQLHVSGKKPISSKTQETGAVFVENLEFGLDSIISDVKHSMEESMAQKQEKMSSKLIELTKELDLIKNSRSYKLARKSGKITSLVRRKGK
jgi:hypothetical protein